MPASRFISDYFKSTCPRRTGKFQLGSVYLIFREVKVPVICINADLWPTNIEANRRYMMSFDVKIMKGAGHFLMLERPEEFNRLLDSSIKEIIRN
jgi:pimeloyl-ACP methyl ester carboxylesterase